MNELILDIGMYVTYALLAIAALTAVLFPIFYFIKDFRKAKGTIIGLAVLLIIVFIAYAFSSNEAYEAQNVGSTISRWISSGIITVFVLIGLAAVAAVYTEVSKIFSK